MEEEKLKWKRGVQKMLAQFFKNRLFILIVPDL